MTYQEAYVYGEQALTEVEIADAKVDAWLLLEHVTKCSRVQFYINPNGVLTDAQCRDYIEMIGERKKHIPLQHLTGVQEFMGLEFQVNEHVLIPRQDTETLVEEALQLIKTTKSNAPILDMCTGSGCVLISLLYHSKKQGKVDIEGVGVDLSEAALVIARRNSQLLQVKACFLESDLFANLDQNKRYQVIVSNPPYIPTEVIETLQDEVRFHDPILALDGKEDGLFFYKRMIQDAGKYLEKEGYLLFEIGAEQGMAVCELMKNAGYQDVIIKKDLAGLDRVVIGMYDK